MIGDSCLCTRREPRASFKMVEESVVPNKRTEPLKGVPRSCSPFIDDRLL